MGRCLVLGASLIFWFSIGFGAPKHFCQTYANSAVKQYGMMQEAASYECHPHKESMPLWSPDPRDHYNWCIHKAVSSYKAARELERREHFLVEACHYDAHYAEKPEQTTAKIKSPKRGKKSFFHRRVTKVY